MAKKSVKLNNLEEKIRIINDNILNIEKYFSNEYFDYIVTNPPYQKNNTGLKSENIQQLISRHEVECTLEDIIQKSFKMLKDRGSFFMINRPERLVDILYLMRKNKLEPKEIRFVYPKVREKPNLILIKSVKYNDDGKYTDEILKIYNKK